MALHYLPAPEPYTGSDKCSSCAGVGITGEKYEMPATAIEGLIVDEICPECGGCGRCNHEECDPKSHLDWDPADADYEEDDFDPSGETNCLSCHNRRWYPMQIFAADPDDQGRARTLRAPCGCAEPLMVVVDVLAGPGSDPSAGYVI